MNAKIYFKTKAMNRYRRLKNVVKRRLGAIPKTLCEDCCYDIEHMCVVEEYHVLCHFDNVFSRRSSVQQFRLKLLEDLLFECVQNSEDVINHLFHYQEARPWFIDVEGNKENIKP